MTGGQRQFKRPLDTCPEEFQRHYLGDCQTCDRPMASNRLMKRVPELKQWFMHANNAIQCRSCYSHHYDTPTTKQPKIHQLGPDLIRWLRAETGACLACGWLPDEPDEDGTMEGHGDRGCSLAVEPRSPSGNDHLRESA